MMSNQSYIDTIVRLREKTHRAVVGTEMSAASSYINSLARLKGKAEKLDGWIYHTLRTRENRSIEEISHALKCIGDWMTELGYESGDDLWGLDEHVDFFVGHWPIPAVEGKCPLNINCSPPLEHGEFSLLIGLILVAWAKKYLSSAKKRLLGVELLISAMESVYWWESSRGLSRCRNPEGLAFQFREAIEQREMRVNSKLALSRSGKAAAEAKHAKPGGSRDKQNEMRKLWASGNYTTRDICAEQEWAAVGLSLSRARKALTNTPDPKRA